MGSTYANVTVVGGTLDAVRAALAGTGALLAASGDDVVVFSPHDDGPSMGEAATATQLSTQLGLPVVDAVVFDEDFLHLRVLVDGRVAVEAVAPPNGAEIMADMMGDAAEAPGELLGGQATPDPAPTAHALVAAIGRGEPDAVRDALAADNVFATESHHAVCAALGLPTVGVGWGHRYLTQDRALFDEVPLVEA